MWAGMVNPPSRIYQDNLAAGGIQQGQKKKKRLTWNHAVKMLSCR
jgi:hypothetical protein